MAGETGGVRPAILRLEMKGKYLVLAAMIFAVATMFIDQTIVAIAVPTIGRSLALSATGAQWVVNGYLLALAALIALGGKLSDVVGHRRMVVIGMVGFGAASALCGLAPAGHLAEAWLVGFRFVQGAFGALLFPAALAIVVDAFAPHERGKALALFFGITGGLTSIGPIAGSFLLPWTWRAIFWINVPIIVIALVLTARARPADERRDVAIDVPGAVLVCAGMGLSVLGLQEASRWGWNSPATWACIVGGFAILAAFVAVELRAASPLIDLRIFAHRGFAADCAVLFLVCACFVPLFFFASIYAQAVLGYDAAKTGLYLLVIFAGFATGSQFGGRILDRRGARPAAVAGSVLGAVGFVLWANHLHSPLSAQWPFILLAGAGLGLALTSVSTDSVNRARRGTYGEVSGVTQTVRYYASSLGLAVLGTVLIDRTRSTLVDFLGREGVPAHTARAVAARVSAGASRESLPHGARVPPHLLETIERAFADATRSVYLAMAGVLILCFVVARTRMERGVPEQVAQDAARRMEPAQAEAQR